jgi:hypothetical protein
MKLIFAALMIVLPVSLAACGGDDGDEEQVLADVAAYILTQPQPNVFEPQGLAVQEGEHDCFIPTKPSPRAAIEGTCEWDVENTGEGWLVTVTETWNCADYNAVQGTTDFCPGETGTREWAYAVTNDGQVSLAVDGGDLPPESLGEGDQSTPAPTVAPTP